MISSERSPATRWRVVKEVFDAVVDAPEGERDSILRERCGDDAMLRADVESLLATDSAASDDAFDDSARALVLSFAAGEDDDLIGARIGAWQIERTLGRGGMGTVYLAAREEDGFRKRVAIKVMRHGVASGELLRRFRNERRILSQLDHPNVAQFFDGGTYDGRPFLVMEHVEGTPIDRYCSESALSVRRRVELIAAVCGAVQAAHRRLVVHRDIKPSNILVTPNGEPKLLDFGIAKLLDPAASGGQTVADLRMLTPEYASPEQLAGDAITVATDVYSLGVVLYELLAGRRPYEVDGSTTREILRRLETQRPERPSAVAARQHREKIDADLDAIVLKAIRIEPAERYQSIDALIDDLQRYLVALPVRARRGGAFYRARKFLRRHRAAVAATVALVAAIAAGGVATVRQSRIAERERAQAERRFDDVRRLANALIFETHASLAKVPGTLAARQVLVERATEYLDDLTQSAGEDRTIQAELATASAHLAKLTFDTKRSLDLHRKANAIFARLHAEEPRNEEYARDYVDSLAGMADGQKIIGDFRAALQDYDRAARIVMELRRLHPDDKDAQELASDIAINEGVVFDEAGVLPLALHSCEDSLALSRSAADANPTSPLAGYDLLNAEARCGSVLSSLGRRGEAEMHLTKSVAIADALVAQYPLDAGYQRALWSARRRHGLGRLAAHDPSAAAEIRSAADVIRLLAAADPADDGHRRWLAVTLLNLGDALSARGDDDAALKNLREAREISASLVERDEARVEAKIDLVVIEARIAEAEFRLRDISAAQRALASAATLADRLIEQHVDAVVAYTAVSRAAEVAAAHGAPLPEAARFRRAAGESTQALVVMARSMSRLR